MFSPAFLLLEMNRNKFHARTTVEKFFIQCQYHVYSTPLEISLYSIDRNLAKANCTGNRVCTSCDTVVLDFTQ